MTLETQITHFAPVAEKDRTPIEKFNRGEIAQIIAAELFDQDWDDVPMKQSLSIMLIFQAIEELGYRKP